MKNHEELLNQKETLVSSLKSKNEELQSLNDNINDDNKAHLNELKLIKASKEVDITIINQLKQEIYSYKIKLEESLKRQEIASMKGDNLDVLKQENSNLQNQVQSLSFNYRSLQDQCKQFQFQARNFHSYNPSIGQSIISNNSNYPMNPEYNNRNELMGSNFKQQSNLNYNIGFNNKYNNK